MAFSKEELRSYHVKLSRARSRLLSINGFIHALALQFKLSVDEDCKTVYFDGERIAFSPSFLDELEIEEISHAFMHELIHYIKGHFYVKKADKAILDLACDVEAEHIIYELYGGEYHSVGGYVIPYRLQGRRGLPNSENLEAFYNTLLEQKMIATYKSFDDHSRWDKAKKSCKSKMYIERAIAICKLYNEESPSYFKEDLEKTSNPPFVELENYSCLCEEILEGGCTTVPKDAQSLLSLVCCLVEHAKNCKRNMQKMSNLVSYALLMPGDFVAILFKGLCKIDTDQEDFLGKIPEFKKWMITKGGLFYGTF